MSCELLVVKESVVIDLLDLQGFNIREILLTDQHQEAEAAPALKKWGGQEKFFRTTPIFHESHAHLEKEEPL